MGVFMRFLGLVFALAIVAYLVSQQIQSPDDSSAEIDRAGSRPQEIIDQSEQSVEQINMALDKHQKKLDKPLD